MNIIAFEEYCGKCRYYSLKETEEPCYECLNVPARPFSKIPEYFEEGAKKSKKKKKENKK